MSTCLLCCYTVVCTTHIVCCRPLKVMPSTANSRKHTSKVLPSSRATHLNSSTQVNRATHRNSRVTVSYLLSNSSTCFFCRRHHRLSLALLSYLLKNNTSSVSWWLLLLGIVNVPDVCQDIIKSKKLKGHPNE